MNSKHLHVLCTTELNLKALTFYNTMTSFSLFNQHQDEVLLMTGIRMLKGKAELFKSSDENVFIISYQRKEMQCHYFYSIMQP